MNPSQSNLNKQQFKLMYNPQQTSNFISCLNQQLADIDTLIKRSKNLIASHQYSQNIQKHPQTYSRKAKISPNSRMQHQNKHNSKINYDINEGTSSINFNISCSVSVQDEQKDSLYLPLKSGAYENKAQQQNKNKRIQQQRLNRYHYFSPSKTSNSNIHRTTHYFENQRQKAQIEKLSYSLDKYPQRLYGPYQNSNQSIRIEDQNNTCARNQLQNILSIQKSTRQRAKEQASDLELSNHFKSLNYSSPDRNKTNSKIIDKSPTSKKNKGNRKKFSQFLQSSSQIQHNYTKQSIKSPGKSIKYIDKYLKKVNKNAKTHQKTYERYGEQSSILSPSPKNKSSSKWDYNGRKIKTNNCKDFVQLNIQKYNHPLKKSKLAESRELTYHLNSPKSTKQYQRQQFITAMKNQCYVQRFLNENQLSQIYLEFCHKQIPRFKWEQKVIQKIFNKIHQATDIL